MTSGGGATELYVMVPWVARLVIMHKQHWPHEVSDA